LNYLFNYLNYISIKFCKLLSSAFFLSIIVISFLFSTVSSCRKSEDVVVRTDNELVQKFFQIPEDASDALRNVIADIRRQNDKPHFVNQLGGKYGLPAWGKSIANVPVRNIPMRQIHEAPRASVFRFS
jgi:hypothetical protein